MRELGMMSEFGRKCVAAVASVVVTGVIVFSLVGLAHAYGVFTWMDAAEKLAQVSSVPHHI